LFVGNMLVSNSALDYFKGHLDVLWHVPLAVFVLSVYYAVIGLAISSLTDRRIVAGSAIIGLFLVTSITAAVLVGPNDNGFRHSGAGALFNILAMPLYLRDIIFLGHVSFDSPLSGVAHGGLFALVVYLGVVTAGIAVLLRRYRWVER
jgi:hypothetical protein